MTTTGSTPPSSSPSNPERGRAPFGIPGRLFVIVLFMTQFISFLVLLGIVLPTYHDQGFNIVLLIAAATGVLIVGHLALGGLGRRVPIRCINCKARSYFRGFGWWPFIYRFNCSTCGVQRRMEISG